VFVSLMPLGQACFCEVPSGVQPLKQPGYVLAEGLDGAERFFVLLDLAFGPVIASFPPEHGKRADAMSLIGSLVDRSV
jgi:hypothetical protein